jgi:GNAT superfamily N-acetyltransferase
VLAPLTADEIAAWRTQLLDLLTSQRSASRGDRAPDIARSLLETLPDDLTLSVSGGRAWLRERPAQRELTVVALSSPDLLAELERFARSRGADRLLVNAFAHETELSEALDARGYVAAGTQMRLRLSDMVDTPVTFRPMTSEEYVGYLAAGIASYGDDLARAGLASPELAQQQSAAELDELLPEGLATDGMQVLTAVVDDRPVGMLWLEVCAKAFVLDVVVEEHQRGRGLGRGIMLAAHNHCLANGITEIGLNVFGFNTVARRLYDALGYELLEQLRVLRL